ncbi:hypothetical protein HG531_009888 [Fusarium graminearum]|nr:hypothetical protein HG531_009888 [Fusarium graminearum]
MPSLAAATRREKRATPLVLETLSQKYFLQDFDIVKHPDPTHSEVWYAPGPLTLMNVMPWNVPRLEEENNSTDGQTQEVWSGDETPDTALQRETSANVEESSGAKETEEIDEEMREEIREDSHRSGRFVTYALSRKSVIDMIGKNRSLQAKMGAQRSGMGTYGLPPVAKRVFRPDMGNLLLKMMRRRAVDALIERSSSRREGKELHKFIMPVGSWEDAARSVAGGAVLYIPTEPTEDMNNYATLDVENANYGNKVAVHDLLFLLGESEVERLKTEAEDFRDQELLILKNHRSESVRTTHVNSDMDSNPECIQPADWQTGKAVPVFLLHDGGGTTFSYHCLEPLKRPVYGIYNPSFHSGEPFDGGLKDMAKLYTRWIIETVEKPDFPRQYNSDGKIPILLGGWSMGGHLSLEIAKQLNPEDTEIRVIGILMVDTVYPLKYSSNNRRRPGEGTEGRNKNQILADIAMADARRMIQSWDPPIWDEDSIGERPRISLLRAKEAVPFKDGEKNLVDMSREERNLGWDSYDKNLFSEVVDIDGHHFEVFAFKFIEDISEKMRESLDGLERASRS